MNLTEAKLKQLILEVMEDEDEDLRGLIQKAEKQAQEAKYPEAIVQAIELLKDLDDRGVDGIEATVDSKTGNVIISGDYLDRIGKLFDRLKLKAGHGGLKGDDGRPFITADLSPDVEDDLFYDEDGLGNQEPSSLDVNPHGDLSARQWKSNVRPKR